MRIDNLKNEYNAILSILNYDLFNISPDFDSNVKWYKVYKELIAQGILGFSEKSLKYILDNKLIVYNENIHKTLPQSWERNIKNIYVRYNKFLLAQTKLVDVLNKYNIKYIIFKGIATSIYYPKCEGRTLGDIDFIIKREDEDKTNEALLREGFVIEKIDNERHSQYLYNDIRFEMHISFALLSERNKSEYIDNLLFKNIDKPYIIKIAKNEIPTFSTKENGIMLLEHINQHLKNGIGLRNYLDFLMYINKYIDDDYYNSELKTTVKMLGLEKLAKVLTRTAIIYFGVKNKNRWCEDIDDEICYEFIEFLFMNGNFGIKKGDLNVRIKEAMDGWKRSGGLFKHLQKKGEEEWLLLKKYKFLKPFASFYKMSTYIKKVFKYKNISKKIIYVASSHIRKDTKINYMEKFGGIY